MQEAPKKVRRYDIDWLRVILFGLLIPFHVGIGVYWGAYDFVQPEYGVEGEAERDDLNADAGEDAVNVYSFLGTSLTDRFIKFALVFFVCSIDFVCGNCNSYKCCTFW